MLTLTEVRKTFGRTEALKGVSFIARSGAVTALLGPNGAGKTTTIRVIAGILAADGGSVAYDGERPGPRWRTTIGYLPESGNFYPGERISEQLLYLARLRMRAPKREIEAKILALAERLDVARFLDRSARELSKGNVQKLQLVGALVHEPRVLLLDEPFSGLDPISSELVASMIADARAAGKTVLLSTHRMDALEEVADRVCIISDGRVAADVDLARTDLAVARRVRVRYTSGETTEVEAVDDEDVVRTLRDALARDPLLRFELVPFSIAELYKKTVAGVADA